MLYAIITEDVPDSGGKRAAARDAHMKRMSDLQNTGRLIISGPCPAIDSPDPGPAGFSGSVIVAEFEKFFLLNVYVPNSGEACLAPTESVIITIPCT